MFASMMYGVVEVAWYKDGILGRTSRDTSASQPCPMYLPVEVEKDFEA